MIFTYCWGLGNPEALEQNTLNDMNPRPLNLIRETCLDPAPKDTPSIATLLTHMGVAKGDVGDHQGL